MSCELCEREVDPLTVHHLVPKSKNKGKKSDPGPTALICGACHRQIHSLFTNTQLANDLNSLDKLRNEPRMHQFLAWARKQDPAKRIRVRGRRD